MDRGVAEVVHRVVVAVVRLHRGRVVAQQVGRLLDLAEGLDPVLADLDRHERRVVHQPLADQVTGPLDDRHALAPGHRRPCRLRAAGRCHGLVDVGRGPAREGAQHDVAIDRRADLERPVAVAPGAVDVVPAVGRRSLVRAVAEGRLELGVELLVVGAQGRVGDLDTRC